MEKFQEGHCLRSYSMLEWGSPQLVLYLVLMWSQQRKNVLECLMLEGVIFILNSCKYLISNYALVTSILSDRFFSALFFHFLLKASQGPWVGNAPWEGERYYWDPGLISPMVVFLPVLIPFSARLCSLLLTPLKIATVPIFRTTQAVFIVFTSYPTLINHSP